jgi:Mce-associated membrane protein
MSEDRVSVDDHFDASPEGSSESPSQRTKHAAPTTDEPRRPRLPAVRLRRRRHPVTHPWPSKRDDDATDCEDEIDEPDANVSDVSTPPRTRNTIARAVSFGVIPFVGLVLALGAAYLKYEDSTIRAGERAGVESVQAAKESTIAMLSYTPDTAQAALPAARDRLTGTFRDSYTSLINDIVIPGAKQQNVSATATVTATASVSASAKHAVALVFVDQAVVTGNNPPSSTTSVVQITLDKIGNRWLVSDFEPK